MRRAIGVSIRGTWPLAAVVGTATLAHADRHRRRMRLTTDQGEPFLLDLKRPARLADGDGLQLENGSYIMVRSAAEPCLKIYCPDPPLLARVAWHLGNRHLPLQILADGLLIRADHVIADMVVGLGAFVQPLDCPFDPEAGAYEGTHGHDHDHALDHDHDPHG